MHFIDGPLKGITKHNGSARYEPFFRTILRPIPNHIAWKTCNLEDATKSDIIDVTYEQSWTTDSPVGKNAFYKLDRRSWDIYKKYILKFQEYYNYEFYCD